MRINRLTNIPHRRPATEQFPGTRYTIQLETWTFQGEYGFALTAVHRQTKRWSCINTLNAILSWFEINGNSELVGESDWLISKARSEKYRRRAKKLLSDEKSLAQLEAKLDEDRFEGEWANMLET